MNHNRQLSLSGPIFEPEEKRSSRRTLEDEGRFQSMQADEAGAEWTDLDFDEAIELFSRSYVNPYSVALGLRRGEPVRVRLPFVYVRWLDREEVGG